MKRIVQNLLAVFLLAVLLVPVTALGEDGTVTKCSNCNSTNIYMNRTIWRNGKHCCVYKCDDCRQETYGSYVACDVTMPTKCTEKATCPTCGKKYTGTTHNMPDEVSWTWNNADGINLASVAGAAACMDCRQEFTTKAYSIGYKTTKNPTCKSNKEVTYTISGVMLGGRSYSPATTLEIEGTATGRHSPIPDKGKPATCTEPGLTEGSHCYYCNEVLEAQKEIPASGHLDVYASKLEQAATCTQDGWTKETKCKNCGQTVKERERIPAPGHKEVTDAAVAATCTQDGKKEGKHCSVCKKVLVEQEVIPATGHTEVTDAAVAPTCTETGKTEGTHCSVCNKILVMQEEIPADGHEWGEWFVTEAAKESESGKETRVCRRDSSHTQTREIPALGNESNAPRLHVLDKQNADRFFETTQQGSTLRIVSEYDEVTVLTGTSEILNKLLEQGIQILEFVTPQGTVRVAVKPLLNAMGSNGKFELSVTKQGATLYVNRELRNELLL